MLPLRLLGLIVFCLAPVFSRPVPAQAPHAAKPALFPLQLEIRTPFAPGAFASDGRSHLLYELHLTNFGSSLLTIRRIEVLAADAPAAQPLAAFDATQLASMMQYVGSKTPAGARDTVALSGGQQAVVFLELNFPTNTSIPKRLLHRLVTTDATLEGAITAPTRTSALHILTSPVEGADWLAADGPSNDQENHHRRGIVVVDGQAVISRRYAIDWKQVKDGASFSGDSRDVRSYYAYDRPVRAVADARVVLTRDGLPNNTPGHGSAFHPAIDLTFDTLTGNTIVLDLGGGEFAYYMHLQPGSVRVKPGDHVRRGQLLAHIGCSGDAREPHLHFEVTNSPKAIAGEGLPYLIDRYRSRDGQGMLRQHTHELPMNQSIVTFDERRHIR